jgi:hypothetical protein
MRDDNGTMEGVLAGAGITVAAAVIMLVAIDLYRSTGPADAAIELQTVTAEICGDIGTVAISALPCVRNETGDRQGINIRISSDHVVAVSSTGIEFARPLAVRVYPGNYQGGEGASWNGTAGLREYFNATLEQPGTGESPLSVANGSRARAQLEKARQEMNIYPLCRDPSVPLIIEKMFVYVHNASSGITECEPYVFIYQ